MQFHPITLADRDLILSFQEISEMPLSDFNFTNLWIWRFAREIAIAELEGCLFIRTTYPESEPYYFFPLGENCLKALQSFFALNPKARFKSLTPKQADFLKEHFSLSPKSNRDHFDYVYSIPELIALSGRKYHKKKNHLNKFLQSYPQFCFEEVGMENIAEIARVYQRWYEANPAKDEALEAEKRGIESIVQDFMILAQGRGGKFAQADLEAQEGKSLFALKGGLVRVDGEIIAFSFGEALSPQSIVVHIEKANTAYLGAFQAINQQFLEHCFGDFLWANREEDLGIEGLRKAKLSYQPTYLLEKYEI